MHRVRYLVGVLFLAAVVAGAFWMIELLRRLDDRQGLLVQVEFRDARGLRAGADVRYRGVHAGTVREVRIAEDGQKAVVRALLEPTAAARAQVDSVFWIVTPRFGGLTNGATGLDTLVRDAYLAFQSPDGGSPLAPGSLVAGAERPPATTDADGLEDIEHGDLVMHLLLPENHGLRAGSPVTFRGMRTGEVRDVALAADGTHVVARIRILRAHRQTVTDKAQFWIARPQVSGALFSGFTVNDVSALLAPFVGYYSEPGKGVPVEDDYRAIALAERPAQQAAAVPAEALRREAGGVNHVPMADGIVVVRIVYAAVERDTWSPDDPVHAEGSGLFYVDRSGRPVVVTARSVVDGSFTEHDAFGGAPDIDEEQIQVVLPTGTVVQAGRVWVHPDAIDLAVLVLTEMPKDLPGTAASHLLFLDTQPGAPMSLRRAQPDGRPEAAVTFTETASSPLAENRGAAIVAGDRVIGVYGQAVGDPQAPKVIALHLLPADLQPQ